MDLPSDPPRQPVVTILKAHEFPPTTLRFNPTSNLLISGSADNTVRIVTVPEYVPDNCELSAYHTMTCLTPLMLCSLELMVDRCCDSPHPPFRIHRPTNAPELLLIFSTLYLFVSKDTIRPFLPVSL